MLINQYAVSVQRTDQFSTKDDANPREIAIYGLASEIGSVVSAIKKQALQEGGALSSPLAKKELQEELGDAIWYAFALARIENGETDQDILLSDIGHLKAEIGVNDARGKRIRSVLPPSEVEAFFAEAEKFERNSRRKLSDYQNLAFRTARTHGSTLLSVCASVLTQLAAQLMRHLLPEVEIELNTQLKDRPMAVILGEVAWHLCAIASLYDINMDDVATANVEKARARRNDGRHTPLHDDKWDAQEQFPRQFEVEFHSVSSDVSQMYWQGKELGHPLKDQHFEPDGYRFHDVMHLANAACLGWSPVLRDLMQIKRRSDQHTKDSEDGGRSAVVEELVVKLIHWEGSRRANELFPDLAAEERPLFSDSEEVPFSMLKQVRELTIGHEVYANKYWEWEKAIREGYRVFEQLRLHKGGRVYVDLIERALKFEEI